MRDLKRDKAICAEYNGLCYYEREHRINEDFAEAAAAGWPAALEEIEKLLDIMERIDEALGSAAGFDRWSADRIDEVQRMVRAALGEGKE